MTSQWVGSVLADTVDTVAGRWSRPVSVEDVLVDHRERAVFTTGGPGRPFIVKADTVVPRLRNEVAAMRVAAEAGVAVAPILDVIDGGRSAVLITSMLPGTELDGDSPEGDWMVAGAALGRLHRAPANGFARFRPRMFAEAITELDRLGGAVTEPQRRRLRDHIAVAAENPPPAECLIHADAASYHVLVDGGEVSGLIDFGDAGIGDPAWDLISLTLHDPDRLPAVLHGYGADIGLRDRIRRVGRGIAVVRHLGTHRWLADHDYDTRSTRVELTRIASSTVGVD
ncbi:phosphotransferase family enzyme [Stackebrandtia endophytica]|uniref:Phosphotransferase family enzyme n=1 Tax=Stackebrandtia endophytica TaxID=1496996 RepID=A0A543ARJ9_9ACTN|nr:aminoglycoside phosphotransferase family protein [Stackebrandtia endophytica]TQL75207.1 phosphotransferase family enzyme [Stackebrandtia endophytica]